MPKLKQIECSIEIDPGNLKLKEYGARYSDGYVETIIQVPDVDITFTIHITTKGYIAPGLAFFVYIDGQYQCNRNYGPLTLPGKGVQPNEYEVQCRLRQKEEKTNLGTFVTRDWTFAKLDRMGADKAPKTNPDFTSNVGTIEVVVLRCQASHDSTLSPPRRTNHTSSSRKTSVAKSSEVRKETTSTEQGFFGGLFDGAGDVITFDGVGDELLVGPRGFVDPQCPSGKFWDADYFEGSPKPANPHEIIKGGGDRAEVVGDFQTGGTDGQLALTLDQDVDLTHTNSQTHASFKLNRDMMEQNICNTGDGAWDCEPPHANNLSQPYRAVMPQQEQIPQYSFRKQTQGLPKWHFRPYQSQQSFSRSPHMQFQTLTDESNPLSQETRDFFAAAIGRMQREARGILQKNPGANPDVVEFRIRSLESLCQQHQTNQFFAWLQDSDAGLPQALADIEMLRQAVEYIEEDNSDMRIKRAKKKLEQMCARVLSNPGVQYNVPANDISTLSKQLEQIDDVGWGLVQFQDGLHEILPRLDWPPTDQRLQELEAQKRRVIKRREELARSNDQVIQNVQVSKNWDNRRCAHFSRTTEGFNGGAIFRDNTLNGFQESNLSKNCNGPENGSKPHNAGWQEVGQGEWNNGTRNQLWHQDLQNKKNFSGGAGADGTGASPWSVDNENKQCNRKPDDDLSGGEPKYHHSCCGNKGRKSTQKPVHNNNWPPSQYCNEKSSWENSNYNNDESNEKSDSRQTPEHDFSTSNGDEKSRARSNNGWSGGKEAWGRSNNGWNGGKEAWDRSNNGVGGSNKSSNHNKENDNEAWGGNDNEAWGENNNKAWGGNDDKAWGENNNEAWGGNDNEAWGGNQNDGVQNWTASQKTTCQSSKEKTPATQSSENESFIKNYWADWNKATVGGCTPDVNASLKRTNLRPVYTYPATPLPPVSASKAKDVSYGIQTSRGTHYSHKCRQPPVYLDNFEAPYAVFSFKYRSKEVLEQSMDIKIDNKEVKKAKEQVKRNEFLGMSKDKLVEELLRNEKSEMSTKTTKDASKTGGSVPNGWKSRNINGEQKESGRSRRRKNYWEISGSDGNKTPEKSKKRDTNSRKGKDGGVKGGSSDQEAW